MKPCELTGRAGFTTCKAELPLDTDAWCGACRGTGTVKFKCDSCGAECERPDSGAGRQELDCACGQRTILLITTREGWLD